MIFSTATEIAKVSMGAFNPSPKLQENARSASASAWGTLFLLAVSAWLSQPVYKQYAVNQSAAQPDLLGWVFASIIAALAFAFGGDIARNIARYMRGMKRDQTGVIILFCVIWLGIAGFDVLVQYYGSEIRARQSSGDIRTGLDTSPTPEKASVSKSSVEQVGNLTIIRGTLESTSTDTDTDTEGISSAVAADLASLAEVSFRKSWCGKHSGMHGSSFRDAMSPGPGGEWVFTCPDQKPSFGAKYDKERQVIRERIAETKALENNQKRLDQEATSDLNAGILDIREATEMSFKFLTFALYVICLLFSVRVCLYLIDLEDEGSVKEKEDTGNSGQDDENKEEPTRKQGRISKFLQNYRDKKPAQAEPQSEHEDKEAEEAKPTQKSNLYGGNEIGFKKEKNDAQNQVKNSGGNPERKNTHKSVHKESIRFVGNQPFDAQDNTGKKYASNATAQRNFQKVKKAFIKYYQKTGEVPQVKTIAQETGIGRNTVAKYMSEITVQITKENDHTIQSPEG